VTVNLVRKGKVRRIILLTLGWEELPKSVSVYGAPAELRMREPVPGVLLQTDGGWVLLDTGFNTALVRDPALYRRFFPSVEYIPVLPGPGEPIEESLHDIGVDIDDIHAVAVSHLHHDHAGGLKLFAGKVPVHAQRREVDYGLANHPEPERHAIARIDFDDPNIDWQLADGEAEIAPGITAVPTYGHTPGHQSFVVELDESVGGDGFVFAFDAADLTENIEHELAIGGYIGVTPEETVEPIRKLKRLAADKGYPLIPGHDPHVWPELTQHFHDRFGQVPREDAP
jgi:N-acyl homoserine lactone hydrolase